jgi:hypothetical protein
MYEKQTGEVVGDFVKVADILKHVPTEVQASMRMQMGTIHADYDALWTTVQLLAR